MHHRFGCLQFLNFLGKLRYLRILLIQTLILDIELSLQTLIALHKGFQICLHLVIFQLQAIQ